MILAIDIGNTNIVVGCIDDQTDETVDQELITGADETLK